MDGQLDSLGLLLPTKTHVLLAVVGLVQCSCCFYCLWTLGFDGVVCYPIEACESVSERADPFKACEKYILVLKK